MQSGEEEEGSVETQANTEEQGRNKKEKKATDKDF